MIIDTYTLVCCIILVAICIISVFMNPFMRRIHKKQEESVMPENEEKPISVLVLANDNAEALDAHLPQLLSQKYAADYEVIVVMKHGDIATECVIKKYSQYQNLKTTFIPNRSLFMSAKKLSVTLGVKAARYEWVVLLDAESSPLSDNWLSSISGNCNDESDMVFGYSNYSSETKSSYRFERLRTLYYLMHQAVKGCAYRCNGSNLAFRKKMFIDGDGYKGNLQFMNGEYDFIVNKYSTPSRTGVVTSKDAIIIEDMPSKKTWINRNLSYLHLRCAMKHGKWLRFLYNADALLLWANYFFIISGIAVSAVTRNWLLLAVSVVSLFATLWMRVAFANKALRAFDESIPIWKIPFLELLISCHNASYRFRYLRSDKRDFSTHKL